ncbi:hypothetical protein H6503_02820 [Candidatus Woesearchaeota archaeon]|nr:hypothetical protein [Candidatus Woesearchaeota archaeon]
MGFGTIASQIIVFMAVLGVCASLVFVTKNIIQDTSTGLKYQKDKMIDSINTDITITSVIYNQSQVPDNTTVIVKNTGKSKIIDLAEIDVYIDNIRISRENRTISVIEEISNPNIWDPLESININVSQDLSDGNHKIKIFVAEEVYDEEIISVN